MYIKQQQKDMSETNLTYLWIKSWELMCLICVCYSNIYYIKLKQLEADYWLFNIILVIEILKIIDQLIVIAQH